MLRAITRAYQDWMFSVALVGRPNVGKSTLFNVLCNKKTSLVDNVPGLTRDRVEGSVNLFDVDIRFVDTAGYDPFDTENPKSIIDKMIEQTHQALLGCDMALFLIDAREGITATDIKLSRWLKANKNDAVLIANKCEPSADIEISNDVYKLGFGEPLEISAEHSFGLGALYEEIHQRIPDSYRDEFERRVEARRVRHAELKT
jgi:GTP-binding protein